MPPDPSTESPSIDDILGSLARPLGSPALDDAPPKDAQILLPPPPRSATTPAPGPAPTTPPVETSVGAVMAEGREPALEAAPQPPFGAASTLPGSRAQPPTRRGLTIRPVAAAPCGVTIEPVTAALPVEGAAHLESTPAGPHLPVAPHVAPEAPPPPPSVPTLPSVAAAPGPVAPAAGGAGMSAAQMAAVEAARVGSPRPVSLRRVPQRSLAGRIFRAGFVALVIGGLGAGARFGYDYYEHGRNGDATSVEISEAQRGFLPPLGSGLPTAEVAPVSGEYVDVVLTITGGALAEADVDAVVAPDGAYSTRWRYHLLGPNFTMEYQDATVGYELDVRGDRFLTRLDGETSWVDQSGDPTVTAIPDGLDSIRGFVPMFHDLVPVDAIPFVVVTSETDDQLDVVPLDPRLPAADEEESDSVAPLIEDVTRVAEAVSDVADLEPDPRPTGPVAVRHYELSLDVAAFAAAAPFSHAEWLASGWSYTENIDVWVDDLGVVRQMTIEDDGTTMVVLRDVADEFPDFQRDLHIATVDPNAGN